MDIRQKIREISQRKLTIRYVVGLSIIAFLLVAFEIFTQYLLVQQKDDSHVINMAGRQRMLCLQLAKSGLALQTATNTAAVEEYSRELRAAADSWKNMHEFLQYGNPTEGLPGQNTPQIIELFKNIDVDYHTTLDATNSLLEVVESDKYSPSNSNQIASLANTINISGTKFVENMDKIVERYTLESSMKRDTLSQIKLALLCATLLALLLQALFVFWPGLNRIRQTIVDLQKIRLRLALKNEQLSKATSAKSQFLATMNHEIRTPVNAVIGAANLLEDTSLTDEQDEFVKVIRHSSDGLLYIINDILDLSKIEAGQLKIEEHCFDIRHTINGSVDILSVKAREKNIALICEIEEKAPKSVIGDSNRLRQILLNLLSNAVKFTDNGGKITVMASVENKLHIAVRDTGIGIPPEKQEAVFDSYSQADSSTARIYGGSGLGLNICKKLAVLMEGAIWVDSEVGRGSTFHIEIPVRSVDETTTQSHQKSSKVFDSELSTRHPLNILVADDEPLNLKITRAIFKKMGYTIDTVDDGEKAVSAISDNRYDLVLMDMQMPKLGGLEVTRKVRSMNLQHKRPRIIALTANATEQDRLMCLDAGMDGYISKPLRIDKLVDLIKNRDG